MTARGRVPLVGYRYDVDVMARQVYRKSDGRPIKHAKCDGRTASIGLTRDDGSRKRVTINRVMYAAMLGISPDMIPADVYVKYDGSGYRLEHRAEHCISNHIYNNPMTRNEYHSILAKRMRETEILMRYCETGDATEAVEYLMSLHDRMVEWAHERFHHCIKRCEEAVSQATEDVCKRFIEHRIHVVSLSTTLRGYIRQTVEKRRREDVKGMMDEG